LKPAAASKIEKKDKVERVMVSKDVEQSHTPDAMFVGGGCDKANASPNW